jgi:Meckel syndrome type 1 protein
MKCRICGCEAPAGAKLCKDCAKARKRAFAATVTQPLLLAAAGAPSVAQPRFSLKPAKPKAVAKSSPKPPSSGQELVAALGPAAKTRPTDRISDSPAISLLTAPAAAPARQTVTPVRQPERRRLSLRSSLRWLLLAAGIAFVAVLFAIMVTLRRNHPPTEEAVTPPAEATPVPAAAAPTAVIEPVASPAAGSAAAPELEPATLPPAKPLPSKPRRKAIVTEDAVKAPKPEPAVVAEPAPPNVVTPQRVIDTARPDPLRVLNDALARCARGDLLNRPGCEQQARAQSCGNWWGQIPQCPIGPSTDHGQ